MERPTVNIHNRTSGKPKVIRRNGDVPIAVTKADASSNAFQANHEELMTALNKVGTKGILALVDSGKNRLAIAREIQLHPITRQVLNVSFQEVSEKQKLIVQIPIVFEGTPQPVIDKVGNLHHNLETLELEASVTSIPERITLDVSKMQLGDNIYVSDLTESTQYTVRTSPDTLVASLSAPRSHAQAETETTEEAPAAE